MYPLCLSLHRLLKYGGLLTTIIVLANQLWAQNDSYETNKLEIIKLLQQVKSDSLDEETLGLVDTMLFRLQYEAQDTALFNQVNTALSKVNVGIYDFPLAAGDILSQMLEAKLKEELSLAIKSNLSKTHIFLFINQAAVLNTQGKRNEAFKIYFQALDKTIEYGDTTLRVFTLRELGISQYNQDEFAKAKKSFEQALVLEQQKAETDSIVLAELYSMLSASQIGIENYDEAIKYSTQALNLAVSMQDTLGMALALETLCVTESNLQNWEAAYSYGKQGANLFEAVKQTYLGGGILIYLFKACEQLAYWDEAAELNKKLQQIALDEPRPFLRRNALEAKYKLSYHREDYQAAYTQFRQWVFLRDSIENIQNVRALLDQQYKYEYQQKAFQDSVMIAQENQLVQLRLENKVRTRNIGFFAMLGVALALIWIAVAQYRSRQQKQRLVQEVQAKNEALMRTQDQLIIQEKMASLGQMTAGIAHEIKNPLNFINNFSIVAQELAEDFKEDLNAYLQSQDPQDLALLMETAEGLKQNTTYIREHGERATEIVRGMMEHARDTDGERVPTDINHLLAEATHLAYLSFQAKRPKFNMEIIQNLTPNLPTISLNRQQIQRVIINVVGNACHAMSEKAQAEMLDYKPQLLIYTHREEQNLVIRIQDNGIGIKDEIGGQIFQPFFTTKAAGKGHVGLGLSISYDIITQAYQGSISFESEKDSHCTFSIRLPV